LAIEWPIINQIGDRHSVDRQSPIINSIDNGQSAVGNYGRNCRMPNADQQIAECRLPIGMIIGDRMANHQSTVVTHQQSSIKSAIDNPSIVNRQSSIQSAMGSRQSAITGESP